MKDIAPNPLGRPAHKAVIERLARPIDIGGVHPAAPGLQDVDNAGDHPAVIDPGFAPRIARQ